MPTTSLTLIASMELLLRSRQVQAAPKVGAERVGKGVPAAVAIEIVDGVGAADAVLAAVRATAVVVVVIQVVEAAVGDDVNLDRAEPLTAGESV